MEVGVGAVGTVSFAGGVCLAPPEASGSDPKDGGQEGAREVVGGQREAQAKRGVLCMN